LMQWSFHGAVRTLIAAGYLIHSTATFADSEQPFPTAQPESEARAVAEPVAIPSGYEFDHPELLADQVLWGVAHGVRLLGQACARQGEGAAAEAWIEWQEREAKEIAAYQSVLSRHYFRRDEVSPAAIAVALGLKTELDILPEKLLPACDTLVEALKQPRYDLARQRAELLKDHDKPD
jgi:hypothetical protein